MPTTVALAANTITCPEAGGLFWIYLNWALALRSLGCRVIWLESVTPRVAERKLRRWIGALQEGLRPWQLEDAVALCSWTEEPLPEGVMEGVLSLEASVEADVLLNQQYGLRQELVRRFRRTALLDIDPGLLQSWMASGSLKVAPHDLYFTIGETVGRPGSRVPDVGLGWIHFFPSVYLPEWPVAESSASAPFTTVSSWDGGEWMEDESGVYQNDKYTGFQPVIDLPRRVSVPLELTLSLAPEQVEERDRLRGLGWGVCDVMDRAATPAAYREYVRGSRGEFGCCKPVYAKLQTAWLSDRTVGYLASGKPVVIQDTGPSRYLPDAGGICRFRDVDHAARLLEEVAGDYDRHARLAREFAERYFDARRVMGGILERVMMEPDRHA